MTLQSQVVLGSAASGPIQLQQQDGYDNVAYICAVVFTLCLILYPLLSVWRGLLQCMTLHPLLSVWRGLYQYLTLVINFCMHALFKFFAPLRGRTQRKNFPTITCGHSKRPLYIVFTMVGLSACPAQVLNGPAYVTANCSYNLDANCYYFKSFLLSGPAAAGAAAVGNVRRQIFMVRRQVLRFLSTCRASPAQLAGPCLPLYIVISHGTDGRPHAGSMVASKCPASSACL